MPTQPITIATASVILSTTLFFLVSGQAPAPAPFTAELGPSAPPFGPSSPPLGPSAPTPEASNDCFTQLLNLSDCLSYVQTGSNETVPDKNCCPELAGLVESNPVCLCQLFSNTGGYNIDLNRALKLPSVCHVQTPPVSLCSAAGYPVPGPTSSEFSAPPGMQPTGGFTTNPSAGNDNGGANIAGSPQGFFLGLAFAFLLTFF